MKPSFFASFTRSQVSSLLATGADFGMLFGLKEGFHVYYVIAVACGAVSGAVTNFLINRHWSFEAADGQAKQQVWRYALVSTGSLGLNTGGVYLVTEYLHVHYAISVLIVSLVVGFVFNFPLQKYFVFKQEKAHA